MASEIVALNPSTPSTNRGRGEQAAAFWLLSCSREPSDQRTKQQSAFGRQGNISRHADEDPKREANRRAHDDNPNPSAISGSHVAPSRGTEEEAHRPGLGHAIMPLSSSHHNNQVGMG